MSTTVLDAITRTRRLLLGTHREQLNTLNGSHNASVTTLTFNYTINGITKNALLECEDELMYVISSDTSGLTAVVIRGYDNTTAATHATGATVTVNPRFPKTMIRDALQDEIRSWPEDVFTTSAFTVSGSTSTRAYDLTGIPVSPAEWYDVIQVWRAPYTTSVTTGTATGTTWLPLGFKVLRSFATSVFTSTVGLQIEEALSQAADLRVILSKPFPVETFTDSTDLVSTVGLPISAYDIPPLGAAWRLLMGREVVRNQTQAAGESRDPQDVPAGAIRAIALGFKKLRDDRLSEEAAKLRDKYAAGQWA